MDDPDVGYRWCPTCEPGFIPLDNLWQLCYCSRHRPSVEGADDPTFAQPEWYLSEIGGAVNRRACDMIHRGSSDTGAPVPQ